MILVIDVGNSNVVLGLYKDDKLFRTARLSTDKNKTEDDYCALIYNIFKVSEINREEITGAIISSVVPPLTSVMKGCVERLIGKTPFIVGPGIKTGLNLRIDNPAQAGSDIVADTVAAYHIYGGPVIAIDMGTATTMNVVLENGSFIGGCIIPGVKISLNALSSSAAQLPFISFEAPENPISSNTIDCMKSGIVFGYASMIDGMVERMSAQLGLAPKVVATGGMSSVIIPHCKSDITINPNLLLDGLYILYMKNI